MAVPDLRGLRRRAQEAECREAFATVDRRDLGRVGVGVRLRDPEPPRWFVEVVLSPSPGRLRARARRLGTIASLTERLGARGYELRVEDDGSVTGERKVERSRIGRELAAVRALLRPSGATAPPDRDGKSPKG